MVWDENFSELKRMKKLFAKMMSESMEGMPMKDITGMFDFIDVGETDEDVVVKAYLPQFNKDEIAVKVTERTVEISASHKESKIEKARDVYRAERRLGTFRKFMTLPVEVDYKKAEAEFENGSLVVRLPKKEKKKAGKEIKIR